MKRNIDIVFFGDYRHIVWQEELNQTLQTLFNDLNMTIGKTIETEIAGDAFGVQSVKAIERPTFSNPALELEFKIMANRMDFLFTLKERINKEVFEKYFNILNQVIEKLNISTVRLGINITREINKNLCSILGSVLCNVPILNKYDTSEFGIKKNIIKTIPDTKIDTNLLFIIETNSKQTIIFLDNNTVENNNNNIEYSVRMNFLNEAVYNLNQLELDIDDIIGE